MNDIHTILAVFPANPLPDTGNCTLLAILDDQAPEYLNAPVRLGVHRFGELRGLTIAQATRRIECWTRLLELEEDRIVGTSLHLERIRPERTYRARCQLSDATWRDLGDGVPSEAVGLLAPPGIVVGRTLAQAIELVSALARGEFSADNPPPPPPCAACGDNH